MSDHGYKRRRRRGGGNNTGSTPSGGNGGGGGGVGGQPGGVSPPTLPTHPPMGGRDASKVLPLAPYVPISDLTIQQQLRDQLVAPLNKKGTMVVASAKFSHYASISDLEGDASGSSLNPEIKTQVYHTANRYNGKQVLLRRLVDVPHLSPDLCAHVFEVYRSFRHPTLVPLHSIVATTDFVLGHNDVLLEYRYVRGARTLQEVFGHQGSNNSQQQSPDGHHHHHGHEAVTEGLLWSIACQLGGLIRVFHEVGVPLRGLHLSKLLYLPVGQRVLFAGAGLKDLLEGGVVGKDNLDKALRNDVVAFGNVLLKLALRNSNVASLETLQKQTTISPVLLHFISTCLEGNMSIAEVCRGLGERMAMEVGQQLGHADFLVSECAKELHNGRLMKLLVKLNFAFAATSDMSAEPEQIAIRLLFHYIFHQTDENSRPRYDWGHVYFSLNKLDTRSEDLVQLMSENDGTLLVISYADLRTLLDRVCSNLNPKPDAPTQPGLA